MIDLTNSLLQQHFEWVRHNESERWWIMGAWLAATGYFIYGIFGESGFTDIFTIAWLHMLFSLIILMMLLKHTLEVKRLLEYANMVVRNEGSREEGYGEEYSIQGLWQIVRKGKADKDTNYRAILKHCLKRFIRITTYFSFTTGFITLLSGGIYFDVGFIWFKGLTIVSFTEGKLSPLIIAFVIWIAAHICIWWFEKRIESYYQK